MMNIRCTFLLQSAALVVWCFVAECLVAADPSRRFVSSENGKLAYEIDARGNRIPDFSHCGYRGSSVPIPNGTIRVVVAARPGDATERIQAAIDFVASLPFDADGLRGVVLLSAGRHEIAGQLRLRSSGVVLRGQGRAKNGTHLIATGAERRSLIRIFGKADRVADAETPFEIDETYVPVGANKIKLKSAAGLKVGSSISIDHPSTQEWIASVRMDKFPTDAQGSWLDWKPGSRDLHWDRTITGIDGDTISFAEPIASALDCRLSRCRVVQYSWPGRISNVGVENLRMESTFDAANALDEAHTWDGVVFENTRDAWVRQVAFAHFAGSAVCVWESCRSITIEDCESFRPVSEIGGWRRHTFFTAGQLTLFQRCRSEHGRHDFAVGHLACGPNAFVNCRATNATSFSGPIGSWASGVLYDNVTIDGGGLHMTNHETDQHGAGWSAANCVLWQCSAPTIVCRAPPTAQNWAIGLWGQYAGNGHWRSLNQFVKPESLFAAQLSQRLGDRANDVQKRHSISTSVIDAPSIDDLLPKKPLAPKASAAPPLRLKNGILLIGDKPVIGTRIDVAWWRGEVLPATAKSVGVGVTRFVPSRVGAGYTDDLDELTDAMIAKGQVVLEHHWGLWYDRRRDDHQMLRRSDGEVWAPFYEMPWARSGVGKAWDGLSKYDLSKFNPWYFSRLKEFADRCDRKGLVLVVHMYFQHNILEAGAHWADFPWRPANCLQNTGFPEPPAYAGGKRVFMASPFYDVTNPVRRQLHRAYIRHCLDVLGHNTNVIFQTGEEFTGPLAFMQFWLDTVAEWERDTGRKALIGVSSTKDVQDAILTDKARCPRVSVIDMKYWWYTATGGVYEPKGGESLAPRQQLREWKGGKSRSDASVAKQVREYRVKHPDKAVICSLSGVNPWAVTAAGGSIVNLPAKTAPQLLAALVRMKPHDSSNRSNGIFALADSGRDYLFFAPSSGAIAFELPRESDSLIARWLNLKTGQPAGAAATAIGGPSVAIQAPGPSPAVLWLTRK